MCVLIEGTGGTKGQIISLSGQCKEKLPCHCSSGSPESADYSVSESAPTLR